VAVIVALLAASQACRVEDEPRPTDRPTPSDSAPASSGATGDTSTTGSPCLPDDGVDITKQRGRFLIDGTEAMSGNAFIGNSGLADLDFYKELESPFVDGSEVRHPSSGLDDCAKVYFPSLSVPRPDREPRGPITLHLGPTSHDIDPIDPSKGYGYYPYVYLGEVVPFSYAAMIGAEFGVSTTEEGHGVHAPAVVRFPDELLQVTSPTWREQLPTTDVVFRWTPSAQDRSILTFRLHGTDTSKGEPFVAVCEVEDDGEWVPPEDLWTWLGDPIRITGDLRRQQMCHVPIDDSGQYVTIGWIQDVGLSFYPYFPGDTR